MKKTPIRRVSKKRRKQNAEYSKKRKAYLEAHPTCEVCLAEGWGPRRSTDIHHTAKRGVYLNDEGTWLAVCRTCHDRIEWGEQRNGVRQYGKTWARAQGYLK